MARKQTKARQAAIANLQREWKRSKSKIYRAKQKGVQLEFDYSNTNLRQLKKLPTNTIKSITRNLQSYNSPTNSATKVVKVNDQLYLTKSTLNRLTKAETQLSILARKEKDRQMATGIFSQGQQISTVYEQNRMRRPNTAFSRFLPKYNIKNAKRPEDVEQAIRVREARLDPKWYDRKLSQMRENFITALEERFNSLADDVVAKLKLMNPNEFYTIYERFDEIDFMFIPSDEEASSFDDYEVLDDLREILSNLDDFQDMIEWSD